MPFQVIPREQRFFDLFEQSAANVAAAAEELALVAGDVEDAEGHSTRVRELEHASDDLTREVIRTLDVTVVTPYDRDDIYGLATGLDDILDGIWAVADLVVLHRIEDPLRLYRKAVARLYSGEFRAMDVLKWKDVMDQLEAAVDACEDIANVVESIVVKYD